MSAYLERMSSASRMLAEVASAEDAWNVAKLAEAARTLAQMTQLGTEAINHANQIKVKAMMRLADLIDEGQETGAIANQATGRPKEEVSAPQTLTDLGIRRQAVHEARQLRDVFDDRDVDETYLEANQEHREVGVKRLLTMARQRKAEQRRQEVPSPIAAPDGTYSCIVIDPPWPMQKIEREERPKQGIALDYPVMTLDDIADEKWVPIRSLAGDDCHLYLWVTHKFLPAGLDLMRDWGFNYQCVMTWRKNVGITPFSWMYDTEHVLFGRRGNLPLSRLGMRLSFEAPVVGHSVKPDVFYERVTEASPGPRLEMFARTKREGFIPWGNEVSDAS